MEFIYSQKQPLDELLAKEIELIAIKNAPADASNIESKLNINEKIRNVQNLIIKHKEAMQKEATDYQIAQDMIRSKQIKLESYELIKEFNACLLRAWQIAEENKTVGARMFRFSDATCFENYAVKNALGLMISESSATLRQIEQISKD